MYPVVSTLRRLAAHLVYVTPEMVEEVGGELHVRLETPTSFLDLAQAEWQPSSDLVPVSELVVVSASSVKAAVSQTEKENLLAELARAKDLIYTLVLGPSEESNGEVVTRKCRLAVVRGVYRAEEGRLQARPPKERMRAQFTPKPQGTVTLD